MKIRLFNTAMSAALFSALSGCDVESPRTSEGCPIMVTEIGQAYTEACQNAAREEMARARGAEITRCFETSDGFTCISE